ncbi:hypothetical protein L6452_21667 [Arctium lappa]|uniref:Uncharacterized protein n=1 Tax=Arctium lappa TaxID=4217 RepID=A0ACB9AZC0_ARCLA|nr:hypothetical protein L6452_21667 [Arctium lappa]
MDVTPVIESLDAFLFFASRTFCTPFAIFVQIQGCVICLLLAAGWAGAAYVRRREIWQMKKSMRAGNSFAFLCHDIHDLEHSKQENLPGVTVVMPLKGSGEYNQQNWRSQITSLYGGPLEFLFTVESTADPAYHAISRVLIDFEGELDASIIIAGPSTTCSQKIHNQLVGVEKMSEDSKYVLFLDDAVRLHPGSIGALTAEMEKNPEIFIQTGYPLDLPSGSLGSYCIYEYHMPCSMGFATGGKTYFLWGGCMMMHADDLRTNRHGVISRLQDGGYSDDLTLAAIAGAHKRLITSPPFAVFPHPLPVNLNFARYWNYLQKQTFVLESYTTFENWIMNRALLCTHCYLSWGFVAPYIMGVVHVVAASRLWLNEYFLEEHIFDPNGLIMIGCLAICTALEILSMWNLTRIEVQLCNMLSPEAPPLSLKTYNWRLVFVAMLVDNFLYPISAIRSYFSQSINWSGIRYHLRKGKIAKIERKKGRQNSDLAAKRVFSKKGGQEKGSVLGSLSRSFRWRLPKKRNM